MRSFMRKLIVSLIVVLAGFAGVAQALNVSDQSNIKGESNTNVYVTREYTHDYVAYEYPVAPDAKCGQWWELMHDLGWSDDDIVKGDAIMFRESRCKSESINPFDPVTIGKHKGSFGLYQINLFWLTKTSAYPNGFLQTKLERNLVPTDLLIPEVNLAAALAIIDYNKAAGGCGWTAWRGC